MEIPILTAAALALVVVLVGTTLFFLGAAYGARRSRAASEFQAFFQTLPDLYFRLNHDGVILDYGAGRASDLYVPPNEFLGRTFSDVLPARVARILSAAQARALSSETVVVVEYPLTVTGQRKYFEARMMPFVGSQIFSVVRDITARRTAEKSLKASLAGQQVLIKEIQHRVKNNLQLIASLLDLQSGAVSDPTVVSLLKESQNRVRAIALVHEQLYESMYEKHGGRIDFGGYAENLAFNLFRSYGVESDRVRLEVKADLPPLDLDHAMNCGLLLSELVSNALKHAFPDQRHGTVKIAMDWRDGRFALSVVDNGSGFSIDPPVRSIGMQLIEALSKRLGGKMEFRSTDGVAATISFPMTAS